MANDPIDEKAKAIQAELAAASQGGKLDLNVLRKRNAPLATVIDEFVMSKTARDIDIEIARDVAVAMESANKPKLGHALADLEKKLKP